MNKKFKILILFLILLSLALLFQNVFAKYVIENTNIVAKLDIDCIPPNIEFINITNSNTSYPNYANKTHTIIGRLKLTEKNIVKNDLNSNNVKFLINNFEISPQINYFSLISQTTSEKIYEFSITNITGDGILNILVPEGIVEDKSGSINLRKTFSTNINIDNTAPIGTLKETPTSDNKSIAEISCNEPVQTISGWNFSNNNQLISKEFPNKITYNLPLKDYAQNSSNVLVDIKNATNISLEYGTHDDYSKQTVASCGEVSSPNTINSGSICKTEAIYYRISGSIDSSKLLGRCYLYTYWGENSYGICTYSEIPYFYGYNPHPNSNLQWYSYPQNGLFYNSKLHVQLGGIGVNQKNKRNNNTDIGPLPESIASKYLYGISSVQFKLSDISEYSVVYQCYVNGIGWLKASSDGEENVYSHDKPISAIRINIVPKSEKQHLINYWNADSHL